MLLEFRLKESQEGQHYPRGDSRLGCPAKHSEPESPSTPDKEDLHLRGEAPRPTHRGNIFQIIFEFVIGNFAGRDLAHRAHNTAHTAKATMMILGIRTTKAISL